MSYYTYFNYYSPSAVNLLGYFPVEKSDEITVIPTSIPEAGLVYYDNGMLFATPPGGMQNKSYSFTVKSTAQYPFTPFEETFTVNYFSDGIPFRTAYDLPEIKVYEDIKTNISLPKGMLFTYTLTGSSDLYIDEDTFNSLPWLSCKMCNDRYTSYINITIDPSLIGSQQIEYKDGRIKPIVVNIKARNINNPGNVRDIYPLKILFLDRQG